MLNHYYIDKKAATANPSSLIPKITLPMSVCRMPKIYKFTSNPNIQPFVINPRNINGQKQPYFVPLPFKFPITYAWMIF